MEVSKANEAIPSRWRGCCGLPYTPFCVFRVVDVIRGGPIAPRREAPSGGSCKRGVDSAGGGRMYETRFLACTMIEIQSYAPNHKSGFKFVVCVQRKPVLTRPGTTRSLLIEADEIQ